MAETVIGVFLNDIDAHEAINELASRGYESKDISILMKDQSESEEMAGRTGTNVAQGAVSGATTGGVIGALAGLLVGTGVVPGLGTLLIGGPLAAALGLTGAAATTVSGAITGALAGGVIGVLTNLGLSREDAMMYEDRLREGGILVIVPARESEEDEVRNVLEDYGADQVRVVTTERDSTISRRRVRDEEYERPTAYSEVRRKRTKRGE